MILFRSCLLMIVESEIIVEMMNKRATMLANPGRSFGRWDYTHQIDFEYVLFYLKFATRQERARFEKVNNV